MCPGCSRACWPLCFSWAGLSPGSCLLSLPYIAFWPGMMAFGLGIWAVSFVSTVFLCGHIQSLHLCWWWALACWVLRPLLPLWLLGVWCRVVLVVTLGVCSLACCDDCLGVLWAWPFWVVMGLCLAIGFMEPLPAKSQMLFSAGFWVNKVFPCVVPSASSVLGLG